MSKLKRILNASGLELIGDELYLKDRGDECGQTVKEALRDAQRGSSVSEDKFYDLWRAHYRLLTYLGLEDVYVQESRAIRPIKGRKNR